MATSDAASLLNAPFDIHSCILSLLAEPKDLLALALTSRFWKQIIIPYYLEYRELRIRPQRLRVWRHLARRPELTSRVQVVRFMTPKDPRREMYPHTLSGEPFEEDQTMTMVATHFEELATDDILAAFGHMVALRKFTWVERGYHAAHPIAILSALSKCRNLEEVELGILLFSVHDALALPDFDTKSPETAGAKVAECLRNLQRLVLPQGRDWAYTSLETCRSLSLQSPHLQDLTITSTQVSDAWSHTIFPQLTTLHIVWNRRPFGASPTSDPFTGEHYDSRVSRFLEAHPTLKSLTYLPISHSFTLSQGSLPNLEEVWSTHGFVFFLLDSNPKLRVTRRWKTFSQLMLGFRTMQNLGQLAATVEHQSLKELRIFKYDDVQFLRRTAALFPSIEVLDITQFGLSQRFGPTECIEILAFFPNLRYFMDPFLWMLIQSRSPEEVAAHKANLAARCPKLEKIRTRKSVTTVPEVEIIMFITRHDDGTVEWTEQANLDKWI